MPPTLAARSGAAKERSSSSEFMKDGVRSEGDRERLRASHRPEASRASLLEALQPQRGRQSRTRPIGSAARPAGRAVGAERSSAKRCAATRRSLTASRAEAIRETFPIARWKRATALFRREPPMRGRRRDRRGRRPIRAPFGSGARAWRDARTGVGQGSRAYDNRRYDEGAVLESGVVRRGKRPVITRGYR